MEFEKDLQELRSGFYNGQNNQYKYKKHRKNDLKRFYNHRFCSFDNKNDFN